MITIATPARAVTNDPRAWLALHEDERASARVLDSGGAVAMGDVADLGGVAADVGGGAAADVGGWVAADVGGGVAADVGGGVASSGIHQISLHTLAPPLRQARSRRSVAWTVAHAFGSWKLARHASHSVRSLAIASSVQRST